MRIITTRNLKEATEKHPQIKQAIDLWAVKIKKAQWNTPQDVINDFTHSRTIQNNRIIFKIKGNDFRLIVAVNYSGGIVYIKFIGTHSEYDRIDPLTVNSYT